MTPGSDIDVTVPAGGETDRLPILYIVDASIDVTGGLMGARNIAVALKGIADVVLVLPETSAVPRDKTRDFMKVVRLPIVNLRRSLGSLLRYLPSLLAASWRLHALMRADGATRLELNDFYLMHGCVCRMLGFRGQIVSWIRFDPRRFGSLLSTAWLRALALSSDRLVTVSAFIQSVLPAWLETKLIYDPVRPVVSPPSSDVACSAPQTFDGPMPYRLVFVGNYIKGKGQDDALAAFAKVAPDFPDLTLEFWGGDMGLEKNRLYRARLESKACDLGVAARVLFGGFVDEPASVFARALAAINCSYSESFSLTVLEAAHAGLAVIATRSGGPAEIVDDGETGLLVPVGDVPAIADAMRVLAADRSRALAMGRAAKVLVGDRFSPKAYRELLIELFALPPRAEKTLSSLNG